tara:strand:- start:1018 stop:1176 length:159 start_codon:yes stop_codon:yes gene_type:complete
MSDSENWIPKTETGWKALAEFAELKRKQELEKEKARAKTKSDPPEKEDSDGV